jgi:hypothetical protein
MDGVLRRLFPLLRPGYRRGLVPRLLTAVVLFALLGSCASPLQIIDTLPPAPVSGLRVDIAFDQALKVEWTATGDDGMRGRAHLYEIRYARTPPDDASWYTTSPLWRVQPRVDAGGLETVILAWLTVGKTYWVAIRASDDVGNWSEWSDVAMMTTVNTHPQATFVVKDGTCLDDSVDATGCTDAEEINEELEVRWDWDGDDTWDTPWSPDKIVAVPLVEDGQYTIRLQVRDQGHLTSGVSRALVIGNERCPAGPHRERRSPRPHVG